MDVNSQTAYSFIRRRILSGEYRPGESLITKSLSSELKVSATPVREALQQLSADGLVTVRPRLGAQVNTMGVKAFQELCELRLVLESHMAGLAASRRTERDLNDIDDAFKSMERATEELLLPGADLSNLIEIRGADVRFHIAVMIAAKNDLIRKEILRLHLIDRVVSGHSPAMVLSIETEAETREHLGAVLSEHLAIYRAIESQNSAEAKAAMERSLMDLIERSVRIMARAERELIASEFETRSEVPAALGAQRARA